MIFAARSARPWLVLAVLFVAVGARAAPSRIAFLRPPPGGIDANAVKEAVTIYTRDLALEVGWGGDAPVTLTADSLGKLVAEVRASELRLAFWYELRPLEGDLVLYAIVNGPGGTETHALKISSIDPPEVYRAIALKLRAVLSGAAKLEPHLPVPSLSPVPVPPPSSPSAAPPIRAWVRVGYRLTLPVDTSLVRHEVALEAMVPLGRYLELSLGIDVGNEASRTLSESRLGLFDVPIRVGLRGVLRRDRYSGSLGALVGLHVLSVKATGFDGTRADEVTVAAGIGAELDGRVQVSRHLAVDLRFLVEGVIPSTQVALHDQKSIETGTVLFGLSTGLLFGVP